MSSVELVRVKENIYLRSVWLSSLFVMYILNELHIVGLKIKATNLQVINSYIEDGHAREKHNI